MSGSRTPRSPLGCLGRGLPDREAHDGFLNDRQLLDLVIVRTLDLGGGGGGSRLPLQADGAGRGRRLSRLRKRREGIASITGLASVFTGKPVSVGPRASVVPAAADLWPVDCMRAVPWILTSLVGERLWHLRSRTSFAGELT